MKFERNEVRTGIFVVCTLAIVIFVLLFLGMPGLFHPQKTYKVFFDNAAAMKPGGSVLLAGRKVGQVRNVFSPVPKKLRPSQAPDAEAYIEVELSRTARVYRDATPRMTQLGLLGEQVIDFVEGNESSGVAEDGYTFVGERAPDFSESIPRIIRVLEPVASTATLTLDDLRKAVANLNNFFDKGSPMHASLLEFKKVGVNLADATSKDGVIQKTFRNLNDFTAKLDEAAPGTRLKETIANLENTTKKADQLMSGIQPTLTQTAKNAEQMTDTLKHQPWRLIFPSTKKYPEDGQTTTARQVRQPAKKQVKKKKQASQQ